MSKYEKLNQPTRGNAAGTDVAIEAADVTLMNDDLSRVVDFVQMSRKVLRRIRLNIFFSIIYNVVGFTLGMMGLLTPVVAVMFQEAGCVTVVLSSTLLLWAQPRPHPGRRPQTAPGTLTDSSQHDLGERDVDAARPRHCFPHGSPVPGRDAASFVRE